MKTRFLSRVNSLFQTILYYYQKNTTGKQTQNLPQIHHFVPAIIATPSQTQKTMR